MLNSFKCLAPDLILINFVLFQNVSSPSPCESPGCMRPQHMRSRDFRHVASGDFRSQHVPGDFRSQTLNRKQLAPVAGSPTNEMSATLGRKVSRGGPDQKTYTCLPQVRNSLNRHLHVLRHNLIIFIVSANSGK